MELEELQDKLTEDFVLFADVIFKTTLQLGPLTKLQRDFCHTLQYEPHDRLFLSCFRGFGKSYLLSLFAIWKLYKDPDEKIVVVSASSPRSKDFVRFCKDVIKKTPILRHMIDTTQQNRKHRTSVYAFDIVGSKPSQFASLKAVGIGGQMTGARATSVIFDDVEVTNNSFTEQARMKLADGMREANALLLPQGKIYVIGTPQSRFSIYNDLDGFKTIKYPIFYPNYQYEHLAKLLDEERQKDPSLVGTITETQRFTPEDIQSRLEAYGSSLFQLQYQLDTTESDLNKFPLQTRYLHVTPTYKDKFFLKYQHTGNDQHKVYEYKVLTPATEYTAPYDNVIVAVDTCGRGLDELAAIVLATGGGRAFILDSFYAKQGHDEAAFKGIIDLAQRNKASTVVIERNYGGGLYTELMIKYINEYAAEIGVADVMNKGKKSMRIIQTVEPFLTSGKLVADLEWFRKETNNPQFNLWQQAAMISMEDIFCRHDDRIDALATGLAYLHGLLGISEQQANKEYKEKLFEHELESVIHSHSFVKYGRSKHDDMGGNFGNALRR